MHDVLRVLGERARAGSQPGKRDDGYRVVLATDGRLLREAFESGRTATQAAFAP